jgi:hypothetical protein
MMQGNLFTTELLEFSQDRSVRYASPSISAVRPVSLKANSEGTVTVFGNNFGTWDTEPQLRLAGSACFETSWTSQSSLTCLAPNGIKAPPCKGMVGVNGNAACIAAACLDSCTDGASTTKCERPYDTHPDVINQGVCGSLIVTVDRLRGLITTAFSYQAPKITALDDSNGPTRGNFNVTMLGRNFGDQAGYGHLLSMGNADCLNTFWTSDSSILCAIPQGYSFGHVP